MTGIEDRRRNVSAFLSPLILWVETVGEIRIGKNCARRIDNVFVLLKEIQKKKLRGL
jgi:hypothetical protein